MMSRSPVSHTPRKFGPSHGPMRNMIPGEKARDASGTFKKLISYLGRYRILFVVAVLFALTSTVFSILGPKVLSTATTELFEGVMAQVQGVGGIDFDAIAHTLLLVAGLYIISVTCIFIQGWIMSYIAQKTCYELRRALDEKINRLPMGYFDRVSVGDVLSRITNDVDTLGQSFNQGITQLITSAVTIIGVLWMMISISPLMTLIALTIIPLAALLIRMVVRRSQGYFAAQQESLGEINGQIEETFSGHAIVRAFNHERQSLDDFMRTNDKLYNSAWKSSFLSGLMMPIMNLLSNAGYVAVAISGSLLAAAGTITVGDIQAFIQYVRNFTQPIQQLTQVANVLQQMLASAERVFVFLDEDEDTASPSNTSRSIPHPSPEDVSSVPAVEFDHVSFGYLEGTPIIKDFSARIPQGHMVALVGPTGAGKTTLVKLLMRFYDVTEGSIRINGIDIRDVEYDQVRNHFSMVLQDTWLFNGTIRENIRYGRLDATDQEVEQAAQTALAHRFITTLPGGYDMVINEDASNISAGQRQLITIARAVLANREMLILDEATSSVDTRTERQIQQAMDRLMKDRTSFVIAHRLSTIRDADLILCINEGDIVESGTHDELLALGGFYAKLYNSQFEDRRYQLESIDDEYTSTVKAVHE